MFQLMTKIETCDTQAGRSSVLENSNVRDFLRLRKRTASSPCMARKLLLIVRTLTYDEPKFSSPRFDALRLRASHTGSARNRMAAADGREARAINASFGEVHERYSL